MIYDCAEITLTNLSVPDEDLNTIFSRFGTIVSCDVIRDKRTRDSLQYAFIEFENQKDCEQAYFKMQGVLIDDHRIHVDFSQSVSGLNDISFLHLAKIRAGLEAIRQMEKCYQFQTCTRWWRIWGYRQSRKETPLSGCGPKS